MRRFVLIAVACFVLVFFTGVWAEPEDAKLWSKLCASCHDGETAPSEEILREKYVTVERFQDAVVRKGARCMNILKNDERLIRKIGLEIGLKE